MALLQRKTAKPVKRKASKPAGAGRSRLRLWLGGVALAMALLAVAACVERDYWLTEALRVKLTGWNKHFSAWLDSAQEAQRQQIYNEHEKALAALKLKWAPLVAEKESQIAQLQDMIAKLKQAGPQGK